MICVAIAISDGVLVASDSSVLGQFQTGSGGSGPLRVFSLTARHLIQLTNRVAAVNIGIPFVPAKSGSRSMSSILESIALDYPKDAYLDDLLQDLKNRLRIALEHTLPEGVEWSGLPVELVLAGFDREKVGHIVRFPLAGDPEYRHSTVNPGADWFGYIDVITRLIKGIDPRCQSPEGAYEYIIPWELMTLQDALNLAVSLIKITMEISRFVHGIRKPASGETLEPVVPAAGGHIDVVAITSERLFWVSRKELSAEGTQGALLI